MSVLQELLGTASRRPLSLAVTKNMDFHRVATRSYDFFGTPPRLSGGFDVAFFVFVVNMVGASLDSVGSAP